MASASDDTALMAASFLAFVRSLEPTWQRDALCREPAYPRELWFSRAGKSSALARAICAVCLVQAECLDAAMSDASLAGVWGGTNDTERVALRRARRRSAA
jgi:WhiB family redox-sensing transcriptional regulator